MRMKNENANKNESDVQFARKILRTVIDNYKENKEYARRLFDSDANTTDDFFMNRAIHTRDDLYQQDEKFYHMQTFYYIHKQHNISVMQNVLLNLCDEQLEEYLSLKDKCAQLEEESEVVKRYALLEQMKRNSREEEHKAYLIQQQRRADRAEESKDYVNDEEDEDVQYEIHNDEFISTYDKYVKQLEDNLSSSQTTCSSRIAYF